MNEKYYNGFKTLTHNALFNFVVGERGNGKTFWFKNWAIRDFLKNGFQFAYVRRNKDESKDAAPKFWDDIKELYPEHKFTVKGKVFYIDDKVAGYSFTLSTAKNKKSIPYPMINKLCFDEFLIDKGFTTYIPDEITAFLNLYETIARPGSGHIDVICFFLANAITWTNPYFLFFNIKKPTKKDKNGKNIWKKDEVLIEFTESKQFREDKLATRFGSIIKGTKYAEYSIDNQFILDDEKFIEKKNPKSQYYFTFVYKGCSYGVWVKPNEGKYWVSKDTDPDYPIRYALTLKDHRENTQLIKSIRASNRIRIFIEGYKEGNVYFETMNIKNICYEVIKLFLV